MWNKVIVLGVCVYVSVWQISCCNCEAAYSPCKYLAVHTYIPCSMYSKAPEFTGGLWMASSLAQNDTNAARLCWNENWHHHLNSYNVGCDQFPHIWHDIGMGFALAVIFINPQPTWLVVVGLYVCLLANISLHAWMSNCVINKRTYPVAYKHKKSCGDFPERTAFKSCGMKHERNMLIFWLTTVSFSCLTHSEALLVIRWLSTTSSLV